MRDVLSIPFMTVHFECSAQPKSCKEGTLKCRSGDPCIVKCTGKSSCSSGTTIKGGSATDVTVKCTAEDGCKDNVDIRCGTGHCVLKCNGKASCDQFGSLDLDKALSFECIGSDCPATVTALEFTAERPLYTLSLSLYYTMLYFDH